MPPLKITHLIGSLPTAGVEHFLLDLIARHDPAWAAMDVVTLLAEGPVAQRIRQHGVPVESLGLRVDTGAAGMLLRLARRLRRDPPDLLVCWMYHSNVIGSLTSAVVARCPVVWNIHTSTLEHSKRATRWVARLGGLLSRSFPRQVVYCSEAAEKVHWQLGYGRHNSRVIPNGFDTERFRPQPEARADVRAELGIAADCPLVGLIGCFRPQKGYQHFVAAAGRLVRERPDAHFLLCGDGVDRHNAELAGWIAAAGVADRCHLLGRRTDVPRLHAALDVLVSAAPSAEAFPLVVGEAMACGVPCVVTDIGDSALLVGDTGHVVRPADPQAIATACLTQLSLPAEQRARCGARARQRIEQHFPLPAIAATYFELWDRLARGGRPGVARTAGDDAGQPITRHAQSFSPAA